MPVKSRQARFIKSTLPSGLVVHTIVGIVSIASLRSFRTERASSRARRLRDSRMMMTTAVASKPTRMAAFAEIVADN
jgi:hypothetical protein